MYNIFCVLLLEYNTIKKGQINNTQLDFEFEAGNNEEYKIDGIQVSTVYAKKSTISQLLRFYYLVL